MQHVLSWRMLPFAFVLAAAAAGGRITAQAPPQQPQKPAAQPPARSDQVIRRAIDVVTTDVFVRDNSGQFVADLKKEDFEVYEDGVKQEVVSFVLVHGGRTYNQTVPAAPKQREGIILPAARPTNDAAGRIFIIFVDDLHLDFRNTGRIRDLFKKISTELVHEGDMFAIVSTGPSSIEIPLNYDRRRLDEARNKIAGNALKPQDILDAPEGADGPAELKYRAHVAFSTAYDMLKGLEQVHNRRKAFIYISNGYDFNPFADSRQKAINERFQRLTQTGEDGTSGDVNPFNQVGNRFAEADLVAELAELTRQANRANATLYTIDPRGLVGGPDLDEKVDMVEWQKYITASQNSLRTLADLTGGYAMINSNDFVKGLKRIDAETSDYYVVGYYSNNPDPLKKRRKIEVKIANRKGLNVFHRSEYRLRPSDRTSTR
jgi:VWFA-related protein